MYQVKGFTKSRNHKIFVDAGLMTVYRFETPILKIELNKNKVVHAFIVHEDSIRVINNILSKMKIFKSIFTIYQELKIDWKEQKESFWQKNKSYMTVRDLGRRLV